MKLWRIARRKHLTLDGSGPERHGSRWTSPGRPVVHFASEAGLAVLIVLRYLPRDLAGIPDDYMLGWVETDLTPYTIPFVNNPVRKRELGDAWFDSGQSLFAIVKSAVLPEANIIMMNARHSDAAMTGPMQTRPFSFAECLHLPPPLT